MNALKKQAVLIVLLTSLLPILTMAADWGTVEIDSSRTWLEVTFENSVYKAVIRENDGGTCGHEHSIRDWVMKSNNTDQVNHYIDASAQRGPLKNVTVLHDSADSIKFRMEYRDCNDNYIPTISEYTFYPGSPVIKIDYLKYTSWTNTVDIGTPGGSSNRNDFETKTYGQESYIRNLQYHEKSYWNTYDGGEYINDPKDGGSLNYKGHMIMAVANKKTDIGYGRVMPIITDQKGGIKVLKLLWNQGFETFPATGRGQAIRLPYTGYIYLFDTGLDSAIVMGQKIVDGDYFIQKSTKVGDADNKSIPGHCKLYQNYPNPFNPETTIKYNVYKSTDVILKIYNLTGQEVETLANGLHSAGIHEITWHPQGLSSGVYFYRIQAGAFSKTKKIIIHK